MCVFFLFRRIDRTLQRAFKSFVVCSLFAAAFSISSHSGYIVLLLHRYIKSNEEVLQWIRAIVLCGMLTFGCDKEWLAFEMSYVLCGNQFSVMCWKHIKFQLNGPIASVKLLQHEWKMHQCHSFAHYIGRNEVRNRCRNNQGATIDKTTKCIDELCERACVCVCVGESNSIPVATHNNPTLLWAIQCAELKWLN